MGKNQTNRQNIEPRSVAKKMGMGFVYHDQRMRDEAVDAFAAVDRFQFQHVSPETARKAAEAYVDALWIKDEIEDSCRANGQIDPDELVDADWTPVEEAFQRRAALAGIDRKYAELSTISWRRHKLGGDHDYWTPMMKAQTYELRAALQDDDYPHKARHGQSGFGPEPLRYALGMELHDMRRFEEALNVMTPYFARIKQTTSDGDTSWSPI